MRVTTSALLPHPPEMVWPMLTSSRMILTPRCPVFYLGTPEPLLCRLPEGSGQVGAARECVTVNGTVRQEILDWTPPARLVFRMRETDLGFGRCVNFMSDRFDLQPTDDGGTRLIRTTDVAVARKTARLAYPAIFVAIKAVHRFVFRNWQIIRPPRQDLHNV